MRDAILILYKTCIPKGLLHVHAYGERRAARLSPTSILIRISACVNNFVEMITDFQLISYHRLLYRSCQEDAGANTNAIGLSE
jgi:hypothetical protein